MKQHLLYPITLLLAIFFFISSCQKKNEVSNDYTDQIVSKAKEWYTQNTKTQIPVLWEQAVISIDQSRIIIPLDWSSRIDNGARSFRKLIIYQDKKLNIIKGEIVEVIPRYHYQKANPLDYNWKKFSGTFGVYDLGMKFLYGQHIEQGTLKYKATFETYRNKAEFDKIPKREYCWWVQSTSVGGDGTFTVVHTKRCMNVPDNNGGDPGEQQPVNCKIDPDNPDPDQCTGGSGGGDYEPPAAEVINNMKDSCSKRLVDRILNGGYQSAVLDTFNRIFNSSKPYSVRYFNGSEFFPRHGENVFSDPDIDGTYATSVENGIYYLDIFTNDTLLKYGSQEYIAGVILHEMVHGLMEMHGIHPNAHHNTMASEGYPAKLGSIVTQMFPHLAASPEIAINLQWAGLSTSAVYQLYSDQEKAFISLTGLIFKKGEMGTKCQN